MSVTFLITTLIVVMAPDTGWTPGIVPYLVAALTGRVAVLYAGLVAFQSLNVLGIIYLL